MHSPRVCAGLWETWGELALWASWSVKLVSARSQGEVRELVPKGVKVIGKLPKRSCGLSWGVGIANA